MRDPHGNAAGHESFLLEEGPGTGGVLFWGRVTGRTARS